MDVNFYDAVDDALLKFAVIVSRYRGQWVFCKHRERNTFEAPGGHRERGEEIEAAAKRELFEETGASRYVLRPVCAYGVADSGRTETFGMLYYADILAFGRLPESEIETVRLFDALPTEWTYPLIQPKLIQKVWEVVFKNMEKPPRD